MPAKDYYQTLGVSRKATEKEIKQAYRRLARKYHPDVNPGDRSSESRFKEISEAYEVLGDAKLRTQYDQFGHLGEHWRQAAQAGAAGYGWPGPGESGPRGSSPGGFSYTYRTGPGVNYEPGNVGDLGNMGDIFDVFFGRGPSGATSGARTRAARGTDLQTPVEVTLEEAFTGTTRAISLTVPMPCSQCGGLGAAPDGIQSCPQCGGRGMTSEGGPLAMGTPCGRCGGSGQVVTKPCTRCGGRGATQDTRRLEVKIPAGVADGSKVRMRGQGAAGAQGGSSGDLYLNVTVKPHHIFRREGDDLYLDLPVTFPEASLGAEVEVPTLKGKVKLTVPPGTSSGRSLRLSGMGMPHLRGKGSGDLYARVNVVVPKRLNKQEQSLIEQLQQLRNEDPRTGLR